MQKTRTAGSMHESGDERRVLAHIDAHAQRTLEEIRAAIRQPSVSQTGEGIQAMADWVQEYLRAMGARTRQVPGERAPIVEGELGADAARPMLLFYELYDTQPAADQPGWSVPPFEAALVNDPDGRARLVGRGAFNSKGPLVAALGAIRAFAESGSALPVNVRFLIEGEEEIGSPSLAHYIARERSALAACDAAFIPYFGTGARGDTVVRLGFKGLVLLEFRVTGGAWGGPARADVHAWHGAAVASPAWQLARALATLVDARERLCLDGIDKLVPPPRPELLALVDAAARDWDLAAYAAEIGAETLKHTSSRDALHALSFDCTLNLDVLAAGRLEAGDNPATLLPRTARAFADLRLVPGVAPQAVVDLMRAHLDRRGFRHVEIIVRSAYPASATSLEAPVVQALVAAARQETSRLMVLPIHAGAAPMHVFSDTLGLPYAFGGVGRGGGAHGPNEYIMVDDIAPFMRTVARFMFRFGERRRELRP